jgi:4-oxalocrotonate tautomerase
LHATSNCADPQNLKETIMPILQVKLSASPSAALSQQVAAKLVELTHGILGKVPQLTSVAVDYIDPEHWIVGGRALSASGHNSYFLDIKITDETNTRDEKARYIAAVHAAMAELLPRLHEESYIHVHDVRGEAYGYGGRTQASRYHVK